MPEESIVDRVKGLGASIDTLVPLVEKLIVVQARQIKQVRRLAVFAIVGLVFTSLVAVLSFSIVFFVKNNSDSIRSQQCVSSITKQYIEISNERSRVAVSDRDNLSQLLKSLYASPNDPDTTRTAISGYLARAEENNRVRPEISPIVDFNSCG